ncbi:neutral zinc metallopeptidase [Kutzneria buriramensis]|uniref:Putative metalloprotease n=1 Tax=Kutzneria buriramensis TaxID=1045776 RepID=A0A3E0HB12_9PSEU|nr:neutral zinc metallopeptidase [Kutzneria buriramensis]REH41078.1 putative metalloprotease [Kutzneria buriramensis]
MSTTRRTVFALVAAMALLSGCSAKVAGTASPLGQLDPGSAAGLPVTNGPSGPRPGVPDADLPVINTDGGEMDRLAVNTLSDVDDFWADQLPRVFGRKFQPASKLTSYDSDGANQRVCAGRENTAGVVNAFYCDLDNSVSWDRGELLPGLVQNFGPLSVTMVLAHEMGHAVQTQLGPLSGVNNATPSIVLEQQADCYAGAFMRYVAEGKAKHFQMSTGDGLNKVLATTFFVRDQPGDSFKGKSAHGNAFDRVFAFQTGFTDGPKRCAQITVAEINARITETQFRDDIDANQNGNVAITTANLQLVLKALGDVFKKTPPKVATTAATCSDARTTSPTAYCPATDTVSMDVPKLKVIGTPTKRGTGIGDFAAFGEVASRYVLSVQKAANLPLDDSNTGLRTACLVGYWGAAMKQETDTLSLSAGDLDEAVAELLTPSSLIAADVNGKPAASGFARVEAFRIGFLQGASTCTAQFGS